MIEHNPYKEKADVFRWVPSSAQGLAQQLESRLGACRPAGLLELLPMHPAVTYCCPLSPPSSPSSSPLSLQLWHCAVGAADRAHPLQRHDAAAGRGGGGAEGAAAPSAAKLPATAVRHHAALLAARPKCAATL